MGVVRHLVTMSAVEALRDRTMAGADVFNSKIDTFKGLVENGKGTALIISCEEAEQAAGGQGEGNFLGRTTVLRMLVQALVVSVSSIKTESGEEMVPGIAETDEAYEAMLNLLDRQWKAVLHGHTDGWAVVFRDLVVNVGKIIDTRAVDPETGRKFACRYTQIDLSVVDEPLPGDDIPLCIENGLVAMEAEEDPGYRSMAANFRAALADGSDWPAWRKLQSQLFAARGEMASLGHGPLGGDDLVQFEMGQIDLNGISREVHDDP